MKHYRTALLSHLAVAAFANNKTPTPPAPLDPPASTNTEGSTDEAKRVAPVLTAAIALNIPTREAKRGSKTAYPFETMEVGHVIGVKNKTKAQLVGVVTSANRKFSTEKRDDSGTIVMRQGDPIKDANGVVVGHGAPKGPVMVSQKHFVAIDATDADIVAAIKGTELEGSTALIKRDK